MLCIYKLLLQRYTTMYKYNQKFLILIAIMLDVFRRQITNFEILHSLQKLIIQFYFCTYNIKQCVGNSFTCYKHKSTPILFSLTKNSRNQTFTNMYKFTWIACLILSVYVWSRIISIEVYTVKKKKAVLSKKFHTWHVGALKSRNTILLSESGFQLLLSSLGRQCNAKPHTSVYNKECTSPF